MYLEQSFHKQISFSSFLFENDFLALFPEIFLVSTGIFLLVYGVITSTSKSLNYPLLSYNISWYAIMALLYTSLLIYNSPINNAVLLYNTLVIDDFTQFVKITCLLSSACCISMSLQYIQTQGDNAFETLILILFAVSSMLFLTSSADFISLYLAIELQSLSFYVLAALKRNSEFATEAGLKYFLLGAFSSGLLIFGCSLIYGYTGVLSFSECAKIFAAGVVPFDGIQAVTTESALVSLGMVFILAGFLFKIAAAPFHMWSPDVYQGAPTPITAFFVITPKIALFAVFLRVFLQSFYDLFPIWQTLVIFASLASMLVGALAALSQSQIKRLMAFSSINHVGYLLAGFACASIEGIQALSIYLIVYIFMNIAVFSILLCNMRHTHNNGLPRIKYITDLAFLAKTNPLLAFTFSIAMFSMAGIPPLAGFYSKAYIFFAALGSNLGVLAVVGVCTSVVSCFYYLRLIRIMYFSTPKTWCSTARVPRTNALALAISLFFLIFCMAYPAPLHLITHKIAIALCV
ncbi:nad2 (mitochondrion) [Auxenochlorella protothecoides x Auxenochlorella symbiontica]|uniref:NADH dehydrogenasesubunit 2 n=2 Tax=Auxenochlorella protothecoides TaxID=3075 RepID=A0A0A6ZEF6_AUXPR|nr:NADH dehydrogenasesubunit 2 [Auxenochlorella protothecoides]AGN72420.1 NADH dehydrogenasesubunit 2 [Auxenochlorella protothecoides]ARV87630.1 NADH-ubiquinone oxidoreductase chain N [Auxenochlorella protothecoides]